MKFLFLFTAWANCFGGLWLSTTFLSSVKQVKVISCKLNTLCLYPICFCFVFLHRNRARRYHLTSLTDLYFNAKLVLAAPLGDFTFLIQFLSVNKFAKPIKKKTLNFIFFFHCRQIKLTERTAKDWDRFEWPS